MCSQFALHINLSKCTKYMTLLYMIYSFRISADILVCLLVIPLRIFDIYNVFTWSRFGCTFHVFLRYGIALVSLNTIVVIAIERCVAVVLPAKFAALATPRNIKLHIALVWMAVLVELVYPFAIVKVRPKLVRH